MNSYAQFFSLSNHNVKSVKTIIKNNLFSSEQLDTLLLSFAGSKAAGQKELASHVDKNGETFFTYISSVHSSELSTCLDQLAQVFNQLDPSVEVCLNLKNKFGDTPLHNCVINGHLPMVKHLVSKRVDGTIRDCRFLTALEISKRLGLDQYQNEILKLEKLSGSDYNPQVYQWGEISTMSPSEPKPVIFNDMESSIAQLGFGNNFSLLLTDTGKIYSWGYCSYGKLGHAFKKDLLLPTQITSIENCNIKSIACGKDHSVAIDDIGCCYVWGNGASGRLGNGTFDVQPIPKILPYFDGIAVTSISCGSEHTLALTSTGKVFSWGSSLFGRLGYKVQGGMSFQATPLSIDTLPPCTQIACGNWHSACLTKSGQVYTFGSNANGRLGRPTTINEDSNPRAVSIEKKVKKLCSGSNFNLVITDNNILYGWGSNHFKIISHSYTKTEENITEPTILKHLLPYPVCSVECGANHCLVLTDQGEVFTLGSNESGQIGKGVNVVPNISQFRKIDLIDNTNVFKVSAGSNSSMMCLSSGHQLLGTEMSTLIGTPDQNQQNQLTNFQAKFEDVRLTVEDNTDNFVSAHRIILASRCDTLHQILKIEIDAPNQSNQIKISQTQSITSKTIDGIIYLNFPTKNLSTVSSLIRFLYTDHTHLKNNIEELGELAFLLKIERLTYICNFKSKTVKSLDLLPTSSLTEDFSKLEQTEYLNYYHDITLTVHDDLSIPKSQFIDDSAKENSNNNNEIRSYKVLLWLRSYYFKLMFGGNFMEKDKTSIDIYEVTKETLQLLINYIYSNKVPEDPNDCIDLIVIADLHQLPRLKEVSAGVIRQHIDDENICYIYKIGSDYDVRPLIAWVEAKISKCKTPIKQLNFFKELNETQQSRLLARGQQ